jgi:hypothetical protein
MDDMPRSQSTPRRRLAFLVAIALGAFASCNNSSPSINSVTPASSAAGSVDTAALVFDTPRLKEQFQRFDSVARELATAEKGWKHRGYTQGGNFVTAVWALGAGYDNDCRLSRDPKHQVGIHRMEVDTIVVGDKAKSAAFAIERVDASPQAWSVLCNYRDATEQGVTGAGWSANLFQWDAAKQHTHIPFRPYEQTSARIDLGPRYGYEVQDTSVLMATPLSYEENFLLYLKSPESLRQTYLTAHDELLQKVEMTITSHQARKRVFGEYAGDGRPPPSHTEPLSPAEEAAELAKARQHFARLRQLMKDEHVAIHVALRKAFPFEKCWPQLNPLEK